MTAPTSRPTLTPIKFSVLAAVAMGLLGFGALNVFMLSGTGDTDLPGLYTFRSATFGDAVLLPILSYALVRAAGLQGTWRPIDRWLIAGMAAVGSLAGAIQVINWLLNPDPRVNWTFPAPHSFNLAGWYHTGFLVVACGFFAGAGTAVLLRLRGESREGIPAQSRMRSLGAVAVVVPGPTFLGLLVMDNDAPIEKTVLIVLTACVVLGFMAWWSVGFTALRWVALVCATSAGVSLGMCGLFAQRMPLDPSAVLSVITAAFGGAFVTSALGARSISARLGMALMLSLTGAGAVHMALATVLPPLLAAVWAVAGFAALLTTVVLTVRALIPVDQAPLRESVLELIAIQPLIAFAVAGAYFAQTEQGGQDHAGLVSIVAALLFLALTTRAIRKRFDEVISAESSPGSAGPTGEGFNRRLSSLKWAAYLAICTIYSAAVSAFLSYSYVLGTTEAGGWVDGVPEGWTTLWLPAVALGVLLLVLLVCARICALIGDHLLLALAACLAGLVWCIFLAIQLTTGYQSALQALFSVAAALFAGLFVFEGIVANTTSLNMIPFTYRVGAVGATFGLVVTATTAWATGPAIADAVSVKALWPSLVALVVAAVTTVLAPFLAALTLPGSKPARLYTVGTPTGGVLQDAFLATLIWISIAWMPNFILTHTKAGFSLWIGTVLFYLAMLSAAYFYVMKNNVEHIAREKQRLEEEATARDIPVTDDQLTAHSALRAHIRKQNLLALVVLIPGIAVFFTELTGFNRTGFAEILPRNVDRTAEGGP